MIARGITAFDIYMKKNTITFDIITAVPLSLTSYLESSMMRKAQEKGYVIVRSHDLRAYTHDTHKTVDDKPYGGGPGMILKIQPLFECIQKIYPRKKKDTHVILMSPAGLQFTQRIATKWSKEYSRIIIICGHYEGVDARISNLIDETVSVGPYVLTGGELPALTIIDSVSRLIPGVLGNDSSLLEETNESMNEYPQYTRPESFSPKKGVIWDVPDVLLSGNHGEIRKWRESGSHKIEKSS